MTQVQRWTGAVSANEHGGFVAYGDYLALLDRLEKSEKDAARYQWLRERHDESDTQWHVRGHFGSPVLSGQLDTSIDSAMEASK